MAQNEPKNIRFLATQWHSLNRNQWHKPLRNRWHKTNQNSQDHLLLELADEDHAVQRDKNGEIIRLFLYDDGTNPVNHAERREDLWQKYFNKLQRLSELKRNNIWKYM